MAYHPRFCQAISGHSAFFARFFPSAPQPPHCLKKNVTICLFTLPLNVDHPVLFHGAGFRSGFAAHNDPMDATQADLAQIFKQRLYREESYPCPDPAECIDARATLFPVCDRYPANRSIAMAGLVNSHRPIAGCSSSFPRVSKKFRKYSGCERSPLRTASTKGSLPGRSRWAAIHGVGKAKLGLRLSLRTNGQRARGAQNGGDVVRGIIHSGPAVAESGCGSRKLSACGR